MTTKLEGVCLSRRGRGGVGAPKSTESRPIQPKSGPYSSDFQNLVGTFFGLLVREAGKNLFSGPTTRALTPLPLELSGGYNFLGDFFFELQKNLFS